MIPDPRPRQPREEEMKCGTQPADIRMIHRRKGRPRVALLIPCYAHIPAHTPRPFVSQRETASCLLTEKAISEGQPDSHTRHLRIVPGVKNHILGINVYGVEDIKGEASTVIGFLIALFVIFLAFLLKLAI